MGRAALALWALLVAAVWWLEPGAAGERRLGPLGAPGREGVTGGGGTGRGFAAEAGVGVPVGSPSVPCRLLNLLRPFPGPLSRVAPVALLLRCCLP